MYMYIHHHQTHCRHTYHNGHHTHYNDCYANLNHVTPTWSPYAWRPITMGFFQLVTRRGMFLQMMASLKTVPPRIFLMVPLGDFHICFNLNSETQQTKTLPLIATYNTSSDANWPSTLASSGVMVAHLMPTLYLLMASAHSTVTTAKKVKLVYHCTTIWHQGHPTHPKFYHHHVLPLSSVSSRYSIPRS